MLETEAEGGSYNINTFPYLDNDSVYLQDISQRSEPSIEIPKMPTELENFQYEFVDRKDQFEVRYFYIFPL